MTLAADITERTLSNFTIIERVCSVFSLMGCLFTIGTFFGSTAFRKPINRLVFFASFGNMMTNIGTLMGRSYVLQPNSAGCQFQAFLIQLFMPADAFWTMTMAINVYLTFYFKYDAQKLRKMEYPYLVMCYGVPMIVAVTYLFIRNAEKGRMFGNATLWCWVSAKWDIWRIATFYGPVWVSILVTFFIYFRAGHEIYLKRRQLRDFSIPDPSPMPFIRDPFKSVKTTEVYVTTEVINRHARNAGSIDLTPLGPRAVKKHDANGALYSVTISSDKPQPLTEDLQSPTSESSPVEGRAKNSQESSSPVVYKTPAIPAGLKAPSSTAVAAANPLRRKAAFEASNAAWSYTKCALLFFTALLVTWIPSSANRVYSVVHVDQVSLPLEYMSAFVLPLQGFWNALIYAVTSWGACKLFFGELCDRFGRGGRGGRARSKTSRSYFADKSSRRGAAAELAGSGNDDVFDRHANHHSTARSKMYEADSVTELAESRPPSDDDRMQSV